MRHLTIKRRRSFAGCFGKVLVYITSDEGDLNIKGHLCKKLGELKNGEEKSFTIPDAELFVFVIGDIATKELCSSPKAIAASSVDVVLSGKTVFDPEHGNPYVFD